MGITNVSNPYLSVTNYASSNPPVTVSVTVGYTAPQTWPIVISLHLYSAASGGSSLKVIGSFAYEDEFEVNGNKSITLNLSGISNGTYYVGAEGDPGDVFSTSRTTVVVNISTPITISFNVNGGSPSTPPTNINTTSGSSVTLPLNSSSKTGYTFAGWNTLANGSGTNYTAGASYQFYSSVTLYAKWVPTIYYITYFLGGGSGSHGNPTQFTIESSLITFVQGSLTRYGYDFTGWSPATIPAGSINNKSVYAGWAAKTVIFFLDTNGGNPLETEDFAGAYDGIYFDYGMDVDTPTRTGYTFKGWFTAPSGGTQITSSTTIQTEDTHTLYAQWTAINYSISYTLNGGSVSGNPTTYSADSAQFTLNNPTRTGYQFIGWTGTGLSGLTLTVTVPSGSTGNRSYTANWEANEYIVRFNPNGGNEAAYDQTFTFGVTEMFEPNAFTRDNYGFIGWSIESDGSSVDYEDGELVNSLTSINGGVVNVYAVWDPDTITVSFNSNGGSAVANKSGDYGTAITKPTNPTKSGYIFEGWYRDVALTDAVVWPYTLVANETFYASWEAIEYTVTYFVGDGSHSGNPTTFTIEDLPITLNAPTRTYYTGKWIDYYYGHDVTQITTIGNKVLTAAYAPIVYSISYVLNGGVHSGNPTSFTVENLPVTIPNAPTKTGYIGSWNTTTITTTGNKTITASYVPIEYSITYVLNGGSHSGNPTKYTIETPTITLNNPTKTGYQGSWSPGNSIPLGSTGDKSFTAVYVANDYTIVFNKNSVDADGTMENVAAKYDANVTLTANAFTRPQYQFVGWAASANGAVVYANQAVVKNLTATQNGSVTLYAKWRSVKIRMATSTPAKLMLGTVEVLKIYYEEDVVWDKNQNN